MALRIITANNMRNSLLKINSKISFDKRSRAGHTSSAREPPVPWLDKPSPIFSAKALKHQWGALPIIFITALGVTLEFLAVARLAITRDDVYYTLKSAACELIETRKGYKVPIRKFLVFNQKYEYPPGLLYALQGDPNGPSSEDK
ncbi:uncharacterized protein LOC117791869 isoform X2 [Drosophila innubila]|uniref:uncharacterized protein LOC117791869 isoform X2 n=1 Tax=Drosophila innubila TaxID=198719 RepID=UPI00148BE734|nr:uncharacterized protein LOC117791869 isoform X2 [Drosophila innubila]